MGSGKQQNQKMKPFLVYDYLLREADREHPKSASEIVTYLSGELEIEAERRSVYRDIKEINKALIVSNYYRTRKNGNSQMKLDEAEAELEDYPEDAPIIYDSSAKGFYINDTTNKFENVRLLAESVHASRFLTEKQSEDLISLLCSLVSEHQTKKINFDVLLTDRVKTNNSSTLLNVAIINEAMSDFVDGQKHTPEKISFKYLKYSIKAKGQVERKGERYVVSPYRLMMNDGNYYLLCYDEKHKDIRPYRVDRMRDIKLTGQERDGKEAFKNEDLTTYTKRKFGMYKGKKERIEIMFLHTLLDTFVDRFGTSGVFYRETTHKKDKYYIITVEVEVSPQFYGWLCGFGRKVKILPSENHTIDKEFAKFLDGLRNLYE